MPNLNGAYNLAISLCNSTNPYCKYSQKSSLRGGAISGGYQWFDCSGFIWYILKKNGFNVGSSAFTTAGEVSILKKAGFTEQDINGEWKTGDIVWRRTSEGGHTEMVYKGGQGKGITMGAHTSTATTANQVSINKTYSSSYMKLLRYDQGVDPSQDLQWIYGGSREYLSEEQKQNNAIIIYRYFSAKGWTLEAISGMLGNFDVESTFNPRIESSSGGHRGLAQWGTNYIYDIMDVLFGNHTNWWNGDNQLAMIYAQFEEYTGTQHRGIDKEWQTTSTYNVRWEEWASSTESPDYLARVFNFNYEKSGAENPDRETNAVKWYNYLSNVDPGGGGGEGSSRKPLPIYMMIRRI